MKKRNNIRTIALEETYDTPKFFKALAKVEKRDLKDAPMDLTRIVDSSILLNKI